MYRNNLPAIILAAGLLFTCFQLFLLQRGATTHLKNRWLGALTRIYWTLVTACILIQTICHGIAQKWDCFGVGLLTLIACGFAGKRLRELETQQQERQQRGPKPPPPPTAVTEVMKADMPRVQWYSPTRDAMMFRAEAKPDPEVQVDYDDEEDEDVDKIPWWKSSKKFWMFLTHVSRPFRPFYLIFCILNVIGSVWLALQSLTTYPGERVEIDVPGYGKTTINFLCTTNSVHNPGNKSTIWFEGSSSQGIADFSGVQHYLIDHDIASCSYDPPSFGGSDVLRTKTTEYTAWIPALIEALNRDPLRTFQADGENRTYVGWGGDGLKRAVQHSLADKHAWMLVSLDPTPPDSEYLFQQDKNGWTDVQRQAYRTKDLASKLNRLRLALSFGAGWYVSCQI